MAKESVMCVCVCVCIYIYVYIYTYIYDYNGILCSHKKMEILPYATTWMNLEDIMLSEISRHRKTNTVCCHLYVESGHKVDFIETENRDFPGGAVIKNLSANAGDTCLIPGPGRSHMPRSN